MPAQSTSTIASRANYATWANRVIAYLIDFIFVAGGMLVLYLVAGGFLGALGSLGRSGQNAAGAGCCMILMLFPVTTLLVGLYNRVYLIAKRGYSIGQGVVKIKVVDVNGSLLSAGTLFIRLLAQAIIGGIPIVGLLDLLWPLWDDCRQTLHDKAVGSYVVNMPAAV
ncbi:MAG: RDD family protein [Acidobacteriaceae bacterium]|nr:RDD family protein [Acidobacteriaceae bacterium]